MSLDLVDQGSLARPGPIGRLVRLFLGILCLYGFWELVNVAPYVIKRPIDLLPNLALMILVVLCVFNYVVNIGFSKDWKFYPILVSLFVLGAAGSISVLNVGSLSSAMFGTLLLVWMGYFYAHLSISFVLAAIIATPGCEMRAIPELFGKLRNSESKEHHCPSSIIRGIDTWESNRKLRS